MRLHIDREIVTYSRANIALWKQEVAALPTRSQAGKAIQFLYGTRARLLQKIIAAENYLSKVERQPRDVVLKLMNDVLESINQFEIDYPAGQSELLRNTISSIHYAIMSISRRYPTDTDPNEFYQSNYLQICGMLWKSFEALTEIPLAGIHDYLAAKLMKILQQTHMSAQDNFVLGQNAVQHHQQYSSRMSDDVFNVFHYMNYLEAVYNLNCTISYFHSNLITPIAKQLALNLLTDISNDFDNSVVNFDLKFSTNVIKATTLLLQNPSDSIVRQNYIKLSEHAEGRPSLFLKMAGLFFLIGNVALFAFVAVQNILLSCILLPFTMMSTRNSYRLFNYGMHSGMSRNLKLLENSTLNTQVHHTENLPASIPLITEPAPRAYRLG